MISVADFARAVVLVAVGMAVVGVALAVAAVALAVAKADLEAVKANLVLDLRPNMERTSLRWMNWMPPSVPSPKTRRLIRFSVPPI
jgi:hypothetical protein